MGFGIGRDPGREVDGSGIVETGEAGCMASEPWHVIHRDVGAGDAVG